ncbi:hypothetical protein GCM10009543_36860 [Leifsonia naganoensis]
MNCPTSADAPSASAVRGSSRESAMASDWRSSTAQNSTAAGSSPVIGFRPTSHTAHRANQTIPITGSNSGRAETMTFFMLLNLGSGGAPRRAIRPEILPRAERCRPGGAPV